ncbi:MAG: hypothetical protein IJT91_04850 [Clostridia bacterium]|nr:hypothetical protein [Clostridia bacterium]
MKKVCLLLIIVLLALVFVSCARNKGDSPDDLFDRISESITEKDDQKLSECFSGGVNKNAVYGVFDGYSPEDSISLRMISFVCDPDSDDKGKMSVETDINGEKSRRSLDVIKIDGKWYIDLYEDGEGTVNSSENISRIIIEKTILYSDRGVTVTAEKYNSYPKSSAAICSLGLHISNATGDGVSIDLDTVSIDGYMADGYFHRDIPSGSSIGYDLEIYGRNLPVSDGEHIRNISFALSISSDEGSYEKISTDLLSINTSYSGPAGRKVGTKTLYENDCLKVETPEPSPDPGIIYVTNKTPRTALLNVAGITLNGESLFSDGSHRVDPGCISVLDLLDAADGENIVDSLEVKLSMSDPETYGVITSTEQIIVK